MPLTDRSLPVDPLDAGRAERIIATARCWLAAATLAAVYLDATEPTRFAPLAYGLLAVYAGASFVFLVILRRAAPTRAARLGWPVLAVDFAWACVLSYLTEGPSSPFFVFFVFVLLSAAFRWGLWETLAIGALSTVVLIGQAFVMQWDPSGAHGDFELNRLIIRDAYLLVVAFLAGYLGRQEKRLRARAHLRAHLFRLVRSDVGLRASLRDVLARLADIAGASRAIVVFSDTQAHRLLSTDLRISSGQPGSRLVVKRLPVDERAAFLFDAGPASSWELRRDGQSGDAASATAIDADGRPVRLPDPLRAAPPFDEPWRVLLAVSFRLEREWPGRLFLLGPGITPAGASRLRFLQDLVTHTAPALHNLYLSEQLSAAAGEMARADVARELHQSVVQVLVGIDMQLAALARQGGLLTADAEAAIARVQETLRQQVLDVRSLMDRLRPPSVDPSHLPAFLDRLVARFRRESGIAATFSWADTSATYSRAVSRGVPQIVREALDNARKHSGASAVSVTLERSRLVIADDGRGLEFIGTLSAEDLVHRQQGPAVILDAARAMGAGLVIDSRPGSGTRIDITFGEAVA